MRPAGIFLVAIGVLMGAARAVSGHVACFEGDAYTVLERETPRPGAFRIDGHYLYWWSEGFHPFQRLDLATGAISTGAELGVRAMDGREIFDVTPRNELLALDLRTLVMRVVSSLPIQDPIVWSSLALDGDFLYFGTQEGPLRPRERSGFFRLRRDGVGAPERLAAAPSANERFEVDAGFVYWLGQMEASKRSAIFRRRLQPGVPQGTVVELIEPPVRAGEVGYAPPMAFADRRIYYLDRNALWSAPVAGGAAPTRHVAIGDVAGVFSVLVEAPCAYFTTQRGLMRVRLPHGRPQIIARGGSPATDGRYLYWFDKDNRIMRTGRAGQGGTSLRTFRAPPAAARAPSPPSAAAPAADAGNAVPADCPIRRGAVLVCPDDSPAGQNVYFLGGMNTRLRYFPALAAAAAAAGGPCVRDCASARIFMKVYQRFSAAHPRFDADEALEPLEEARPR